MSHKDFIFVHSGQGHYKAVDTVTKVTGDIEGERIVQVSSKADTVLAVSGMYHGVGGCLRHAPWGGRSLGMYYGMGGRVRCVPWGGRQCRVCTMKWEAVSGMYHGVGGSLIYVPWGGRQSWVCTMG